ncbi:hypothetical protein K3U94_23135 [Mycolicibacter heraklionensis]|uniref:Uncharacterized protein n=1 Tax=Mycolicibacter heraklionensis TaxID=512402 RepID=A0A9X7ZHN3_9MYCO|nr:hypothetical protein [Mycolicibacter heraklionensis]QZA07758.1 hypothetical protein K3U94_23135 [Mycolicibacter heraklionensis]
MSRRNREKRAAKHKNRRRTPPKQEHAGFDAGPDRAALLESLVVALSAAASCPADYLPRRAAELLGEYRGFARELDVQARSRSFRQSFLVAYAQRIGERLDSASASVTAEVKRGGRLLPVLAANSRATEELTERLFPSTVPRSVAVSSGAGWGAGRVAADIAVLDTRDSIGG